MSRKEEILAFVKEKTTNSTKQDDLEVTTLDISNSLGISRSAVSRELNKLVREKKLGKLKGKPVKYYYLDQYNNIDQLPISLKKRKAILKNNQEKSIFSDFIGSNGSMEINISLAKAAIMYPPNGLHTIILGSTGVGKTTFAKLMFQYGQEIGRFNEKSPFVHFNCSDYSNNPQLLLSVLFGYIKGAFTGADSDKSGMIEQANHGILFLDEIHRLPPEGQEMLFTIIDTQKYRRLGDTDSNARNVDILIICATTENIDSSLLQTFKRRFPMVITLPDLKDRSMEERIQLVDYFFVMESQKIRREVFVSKEVLEKLITYTCPGNIGQLKNDIQILCAKEFANSVLYNENRIQITSDKLNSHSSFQNLDSIESLLFNEIQDRTYLHGGTSIHIPNKSFDWNNKDDQGSSFYQLILEKYSNLLKEGKSFKEIQQKMTHLVNNYFKVDLNNKIEFQEKNNGIEKLVSNEVLKIVNKVVKSISEEMQVHSDPKIIYNLSLHIEALVLKFKQGKKPIFRNRTIEKTIKTPFHRYALELVQLINKQLAVSIPLEEQDIIELFLETIYKNMSTNPIGVLIIMHGKGVATNMAKMANDLLDTTHAVGLDMALDDSVEATFSKAMHLVKEIDQGSGVLLLVDMGSLGDFANRMTKQLDINVKAIENATSSLIIEATRKTLFTNLDIDHLVNELLEENAYYIGNRNNNNIFQYSSRRLIKNNDYQFYNSLEKSVVFIDVHRASEVLDEVLLSLCKELDIEIIDTLVIKFYFHCLSMIERSIRKENLEFEIDIVHYDNIFYIIQNKFTIIERFFGCKISDSEIIYVTKMFKSFL